MKCLVFISVFAIINTFGQNLVPNPSFEIYTSCPNSGTQLPLAVGWDAPTNNDAEYFNSCATNPNYGVPHQGIYNYQFAKTGNAFVGFFAFHNIQPDYREYARIQLTSELMQNSCYLVTFFINATSGSFGGKYHVNNIGCAFTSNAVNSTGTGLLLNLTPSVLKFNNPIISDTSNWTKIEGIYLSNGNENFITIGNFFSDSSTQIFDSQDGNDQASAYLLDDVSVIPIASIPGGMPANAGPDLAITSGDSVFIGQEISNLNCTWSILGGPEIADSTSGIYVQPLENTSYVVEQNLCGVISYDTVTVFVFGVGVDETLGGTDFVKVYPNPNSGSFDIDLSTFNNDQVRLQIFDAAGRLVYKKESISEPKLKLETDLNKGVYFLKITTENSVFEEKVVIQ